MSAKLRFILPAIILAGSVLVGFVIFASKPDVTPKSPEVKPRLIRVFKAQLENVQMKLNSQGTVTPGTESALVSQVPGLIKSVSPSFVVGGFFEEGEILARLDASDFEFAVIQARQQVAQAELALQLEEQQGQVSRDEWQRLNQEPVPALVAREPQLVQAKAAFEAAKATLRQAELNFERTRIRAPFAGRIRMKNADVGQYVTPGLALAQIYSIDYAEVRLPLSDNQLAYLDMSFDFRDSGSHKRRPEVVLQADFAGQERTWHGYLVRIEAEVDARSRMVHVVARVEDPYAKGKDENRPPLAVGLFVRAEIAGKNYENIFRVPREVVQSGDRVLVVDRNNKLFSRKVQVLRSDAESAFISEGLQPGELLCLSNLDTFVEGMLVEPLLDSENGGAVK